MSQRHDDLSCEAAGSRSITETGANVARLQGGTIHSATEQNFSLSPIFRVPDDILSQIFLLFALDSNALSNLKWTKLILVCRRWYNVGLMHRTLWAYINIDSFENTSNPFRIQLERSGASPLTVTLSNTKTLSAAPIVFESHFFRIRRLKLEHTADEKAFFDVLNAMATSPLPNLESVDAFLRKQHQDTFHLFPSAILDGRAPRLRELIILNMLVDWALKRNMERIVVFSFRPHAFSQAGILDALRRCPSLQEFIFGGGFTLRITPGDLCRPAKLPQLDRLSFFWVDVAHVCAFLRCLIIPGSTSIKIFTRSALSSADAQEILSILRTHYRSRTAKAFRSIQIRSNQRSFVIQGFTDKKIRELEHQSSYSSYLCLHSGIEIEQERRHIIQQTFDALPVFLITYLDMRAAIAFTEESWKTVFISLPKLDTVLLRTNRSASLHCARALSDLIKSDDAPKSSARLPCLRHIKFDPAYQDRVESGPAEPPDVSGQVLASFIEMFSVFKRRGRPIKSLDIIRGKWELLDDAAKDTILGLVETFRQGDDGEISGSHGSS